MLEHNSRKWGWVPPPAQPRKSWKLTFSTSQDQPELERIPGSWGRRWAGSASRDLLSSASVGLEKSLLQYKSRFEGWSWSPRFEMVMPRTRMLGSELSLCPVAPPPLDSCPLFEHLSCWRASGSFRLLSVASLPITTYPYRVWFTTPNCFDNRIHVKELMGHSLQHVTT